MAEDAGYALMIWDGTSQGTLSNMLKMQELEKRFFYIQDNILTDSRYTSLNPTQTRGLKLEPVQLAFG